MSLNLQAPNFSGTAAIAGRGTTNLNLESAGALGLQAVQMLKQADLEQMRLSQEGSLALGQQGIARQGLLQRQAEFNQGQANSETANAQAMMQYEDEKAYKKTGIDQVDAQNQLERDKFNEQKQQLAQQKEMAKLVDEKAEKLHERGSFASYGLLAMNQAKTPEEAQALRIEILKEAKSKGFIDDKEYKIASQAPISQFKNMLGYKVMQTGMAKEYQAMMPKEEGQSGTSTTLYPDGRIEQHTGINKATETKLEGDVINQDSMTQQFDEIKAGYKPEYFRKRGKIENWASKEAEDNIGMPILEGVSEFAASTLTGKTKEERAAFIEERSGYMNKIDQVFNTYKHEITGAAAGEKELDQLKASFINGDMSSSEFLGGLKQVASKYRDEARRKRGVLRDGLDVSGEITNDDLFTQARQDPRYKDWNDDKIRRSIELMRNKR